MSEQGDIVKADLDKAVQRGGGGDLEPFREHSDIRYSPSVQNVCQKAKKKVIDYSKTSVHDYFFQE